MNRQFRRHLAVAAILVVAGIARMPVERALTADLRAAGLLQEKLQIDTRKKIGQSFWAVSLGGLRTLVATILNIRAYNYFAERQWVKIADAYDTIVQLAPNSRYYWDIGSWHMAYNAAANVQNDADLPELRRRSEWRHWVKKGTAFLEEGARQNPDDWKLWSLLGGIHSDPNKILDYAKAAEAYQRSVDTGNSLPFTKRFVAYALVRVPGRADEALPLVRELAAQPGGNVPTLNSIRFVLEHRADPSRDLDQLALEIFGQPERAYRMLGDFYLGIRDNYPLDGVAETLRSLEEQLAVPEDRSVFKERERLLADQIDPFTR